ncbi:MAG: GntR family transcriptional regulator [Clostridia bacterium]|nr:GntR family transcriptional regulator [Clostridia bacterium]
MRELKSRLLAEELRKKIVSGEWKPHMRLMTEPQMVEAYGVGRHTVRQALNQLWEEGLIVRRQGSGTFVSALEGPAAPCRTVSMITTFSSYYIFPEILGSIEDKLRENNCRILLSVTRNSFSLERRFLLDLLRQPVDGLIVECTMPQIPNPNVDLYEKLSERGLPIVFLNAEYSGLERSVSVRVDDEGAGRALTERMLMTGARSFAGLFRTDYHGYRRFRGFYRACIDADAAVDENTCRWFSDNECEESLPFLLRKADIERLEETDALVCYNDAVALNVLDYLRKNGCRRLPRIASFDNTRLLRLSHEPVTAITYPSGLMGRTVADKLIRMINGGQESSTVLPWIENWSGNDS